jgi:hypothetical protein
MAAQRKRVASRAGVLVERVEEMNEVRGSAIGVLLSQVNDPLYRVSGQEPQVLGEEAPHSAQDEGVED